MSDKQCTHPKDCTGCSWCGLVPAAPQEQVITYGIIDPDYARVFTQARCIAWSYGYACAMNGSFTRDLDLLLVPWTDMAPEPLPLINMIADSCDLKFIGGDKAPTPKPHGRMCWSLVFPGFDDRRWVDISVMPRIISPKEKVVWKNTLEKRDPLMWKTIQQMREALKQVPDPGRLNGLVDTMESTYSVVHEDVYSQICDMIDPHVLAGRLPGSVHDSVQMLLELAVNNKLLERK